MNGYIYPAIFHEENNGFWVSFPDFPGVFSRGNTLEETYDNCIEALDLEVSTRDLNTDPLPHPTQASSIQISDTDRIVFIRFDINEHKRRIDKHPVKKTLTIPRWLNELAVEKGINFSATLTQALKEKLGIL